MTAELGQYNRLKVVKTLKRGAYLDGGEMGELLLPRKFLPAQCAIGEELEVFVYLDSEERPIATTQRPHAVVGDFALLEVLTCNKVGAFLDWGLDKDLLAPYSEQKTRMEPGRSYLVKVFMDEDERIAASSWLDDFLDLEPTTLQSGEEVDLVIERRTELGYQAIVNNKHWGLLYQDEVFRPLKTGERCRGFVKKVREDGKLDVSLQASGARRVDEASARILEVLEANDGFLEVSDKSPPKTIAALFAMSKKTYKKAVGALYKQKRVALEAEGLRLLDTPDY